MTRAQQLDGLRCLAVLGVLCHHWLPLEWRRCVPTEIGLYFFFTLTGFLITGGLLRDRDRGEATAQPWRKLALGSFALRRGLRIYFPYFTAVAAALLLNAGDVRAAWLWYVLPLTHTHIFLTGFWPSGISHFWTLAIQIQFYLVWPIVVYFLPRRWLGWSFAAVALAAVAGRFVLAFSPIGTKDMLLRGWPNLDLFACGALLAWQRHAFPNLSLRWLTPVGGLAAIGWAISYGLWLLCHTAPVWGSLQNLYFAIASTALIHTCLLGIRGPIGKLLECAPFQHIGKISYSLYLWHNLVPIALGWVAPFLWHGPFASPLGPLYRFPFFALASWGVAWLAWRTTEQSLERKRAQLLATP